jgi:hypothetical protein
MNFLGGYMSQESHKGNIFLIVAALIGLIGTIIGVVGNYNIEKLRQESAITQIALIAMATQGGATQVSMASTISAPTITPFPTIIPSPKYTSTSTPLPTATSVPLPTATATLVPTPTPDPRLFWDDFENGIKPGWGMTGKNFTVINGKLKSEGYLTGSIGDKSWTSYAITFSEVRQIAGHILEIRVRVQDRDNYMVLKSDFSGWEGARMTWYRMVQGKEQEIPGSGFWGSDGDFKIEIEGNVYRTYIKGERRLFFVDDTYRNGGMVLIVNRGGYELGGIEIVALR